LKGGRTLMPTGICPECDEEVYIDPDLEQGEVITCEQCGIELEIINTSPIELGLYEGYMDEEPDEYDDELLDYESFDYEDDRY